MNVIISSNSEFASNKFVSTSAYLVIGYAFESSIFTGKFFKNAQNNLDSLNISKLVNLHLQHNYTE